MTQQKYFLYFLLLFFVYICRADAQDKFELQFSYAQKLFSEEKYFDAITECRRLQFFDLQHKYAYRSFCLMADAYRMGGKISEALQCRFNALKYAENDSLKFFNSIEIVKLYILNRNSSAALTRLQELEKDSSFSRFTAVIPYWRGWVMVFADEWDKASGYFKEVPGMEELSRFTSEVHNNKKNPQLYKMYSAILPGTGQILTGNYSSGVLSLLWNALWIYITVEAFGANRVLDGVLVANFLWLRFYQGNLQNAELFTNQKNSEITNKALLYLQNEFKGEKP